MKTRQIIVDGLVTRYAEQGEGKLVLFLHGWGDSLVTFHELSDKLSLKYHVVALDLPGFGQTEAASKAWDLDDYAQFIQSFCNKLGFKPYAIVGHSNGGAIAINGLASGKLVAERLALLASAGIRTASAKKSALKAGTKAVKILSIALPKATRQKLRQQLYGTIGSDYLVAPQLQETFKKIVSHDVTAEAGNLTLPTLLIYGQDDPATPPSHGQQLQAAIKGSSLEVLPDTGHFVHAEKTSRVAELLEKFLS